MTPEDSMVRRIIAGALLCGSLILTPGLAAAQAFRVGATFDLGGTTQPVEQPDVAYDSNNDQYLQVAGKVFIEAHLLNGTGGILRTFNVTNSGLYAQNPRVAFSPHIVGGGGYLVTWHASIGDIARVRGRIFTANGEAVTGEFDIAVNATAPLLSSQWTMGAPAAYSTASGEFLVVWGGNKYTTFDIFAQRVNNSGALLGGTILVSGGTAALYDRDPSVAYSPVSNKFVVGWGVYNEAGRYGYSAARSVTAGSGALGNQADFGQAVGVSITSMAYSATHDQFLFSWHNQTATSSRLHYGLILNSNGSAVTGIKAVSAYYAAYRRARRRIQRVRWRVPPDHPRHQPRGRRVRSRRTATPTTMASWSPRRPGSTATSIPGWRRIPARRSGSSSPPASSLARLVSSSRAIRRAEARLRLRLRHRRRRRAPRPSRRPPSPPAARAGRRPSACQPRAHGRPDRGWAG